MCHILIRNPRSSFLISMIMTIGDSVCDWQSGEVTILWISIDRNLLKDIKGTRKKW